MRRGTRIGIDVGTVRVGVAMSDPHGMLATPVSTVQRGAGDVAMVLAIGAEHEAIEYIVGLPLALSGRETASTGDAKGFARALAEATDIPVRLVDERLTTVSANAALRASGRSSKGSRPVVDQVAAVIILQHALDFERQSGITLGVVVDPHEGR